MRPSLAMPANTCEGRILRPDGRKQRGERDDEAKLDLREAAVQDAERGGRGAVVAAMPCGSRMTRSPPSTACASTPNSARPASGNAPSGRLSRRSQTHAKNSATSVATKPAVSRWPCSRNMKKFVSQPSGLSEPLLSGQSGKAMPAPAVVVCPPMKISRKVTTTTSFAKSASPGLEEGGMGRRAFTGRRLGARAVMKLLLPGSRGSGCRGGSGVRGCWSSVASFDQASKSFCSTTFRSRACA